MNASDSPNPAALAPGARIADLSPVGRRILDAARRIAVGEGMEAVTVQAVATEAGVHKSAIGYHFGNKEGLVLALIESLADDGSAEQRQSVARIADPSERFRAYLAFCREGIVTTDRWRLVFALWQTPFFEEKIRVLRRSFMMDMESLRIGDGEDTLVLMTVLRAALTGLAFQYEARGSQMDLDACFERLELLFAPALRQSMTDCRTP